MQLLLIIIKTDIRIIFFGTFLKNTMAELSIRVILYIGFDFIPIALVVPDLFAM